MLNSSSQPTSFGEKNIKALYKGGEEGGLCKLEFTGPDRPSPANELLLCGLFTSGLGLFFAEGTSPRIMRNGGLITRRIMNKWIFCVFTRG